MAQLVSHPDEVKLISYRFGKGATSIDKYLELDGYKEARKAIELGARSYHRGDEDLKSAGTRRSRIPHRHEVVLRAQAEREAEVRAGQWR